MNIINDFGPGHKLNPLNDYLFYRVMGEKGDEVQLLGFLNAVLTRSGKKPIKSLEIMENTAFVKDVIDGKSCVLDVLAVLQDGTKVNIEVQLDNQHNMDRRTLFYWSKVYIQDLKEGQDYLELPDVIAVNIVDFNFPRRGGLHTCFHLREDADPSLVLTEALEIHCINMVEWRKLKDKDVHNDPLHRWLARFDKNSPPELIEEVSTMDPAIVAANEKINLVMQDDEARRRYWRRQMAIMDENGRRKYARDEGLAEGREQGIQQGREQSAIEIARKMKEIGDSVDKICAVTGLSAEVIKEL